MLKKWVERIERLEQAQCYWNRTIESAEEIKNLLRDIGKEGLDPVDDEWLAAKIKSNLRVPPKVSLELIRASAAEAFPLPQLPDGCVEATEQPCDLQGAELIYQDHDQLIAERAWALFRYSPANGFWGLWPDTPAKKAAQQALQRLVVEQSGEWSCPYGTFLQVKATVDQLKVLASGGPFSEAQQPQVIVFRNGTYDLKTHKLEEHSPHHGATYGLAADYIEGAGCPKEFLSVLDRCYPHGTEPIARAVIRWAVDPSIRYGEAFHVLGPTGTGKGLFIDFIRSLFPASVISQLLHPADLSSPEKIHQYVVGKRLLAFPDVPANLNRRDGDSCNLFYEMVENKPMSTRKLNAGESETSTPMHCRFILGSVRPLEFRDGRDGYLRRTITIKTLPRSGSPDATLREQLNPTGPRFDQIRAEAISWALAMPLDEVNAVLDSNDPEGLLRDAAQEAAVASDLVSLWADQCLEPAASPHLPLLDDDWNVFFACFLGWAAYINARRTNRRDNFKGQLRRVLGPARCLERRRKTIAELKLDDSVIHWPAFDAGFRLRREVMSLGVLAPTEHDFRAEGLSSGGLEAIAQLPPAERTGLVQGTYKADVQG